MATECNYYDGLNLERMAILEEEMSMQGTLEDTKLLQRQTGNT